MDKEDKSFFELQFVSTIHSICVEAEGLGIIPHEATCNIIDIVMNYFKNESEVEDE